MFRDYIDKPIDPIPVEYVRNLKRLADEPDFSLTCLGVALLKPRIENYGGITGVYSHLKSEMKTVEDFVDRFNNLDEYPLFCYYIYNERETNRESIKDILDNNGLKIKENIGLLLKDKASTDCLAVYHEEKNAAAVFINSRDIRFYHMLISFLSLLMPSLFKDKPLEEKDYNIIRALSKTDRNNFIIQIQEAVRPYTVEFRRMMLSELLKSMHQVKIDAALREVASQRNYVENMRTQYTDAIKLLKEYIVTYEGMKATECYDAPEEELVEYLSDKKEIRNLTIVNNKLKFSVATLLNNYNSDAWHTFSERGYIYDGKYRTEILPVFDKEKNRRILLDKIFSESPEFAVKLAGNYTLDLASCHIATNSGYDYANADPIYKSYLANPHLRLFSCLGGYERRVIDALRDRNYIGAIELCCASAGSVDLDETDQTFRPFLGWILSSREKILRRKDGTDMTPEEALLYLIDKEKENETADNE